MHYKNWILFTCLLLKFAGTNGMQVFVHGSDANLQCETGSRGNVELYEWFDDVSPTEHRIFAVGWNGAAAKSNRSKYQNFKVNNDGFPTSTGLIIENIQLEDEYGPYRCTTTVGKSTRTFSVRLEAPPTSVSVDCTAGSDVCLDTTGDSSSSQFTCTCTVEGAYPDDLQLLWNGTTDTPTLNIANNTDTEGFFRYTSNVTTTPTVASKEVTCYLDGYSNTIDLINRSESFVFAPPNCRVQMEDFSYDCRSITLVCGCQGSPTPVVYSFFDGNGTMIGEQQQSNRITYDELDPEMGNYTFFCRGCNGVNNATSKMPGASFTCVPGTTTAVPTTTTQTTPSKGCLAGNCNNHGTCVVDGTGYVCQCSLIYSGSECKDFETWFIAACAAGLVILVVFLVLLICCCICKKGKLSSSPEDTGVQLTANRRRDTSGLASLYGKRDKSRKRNQGRVNTSNVDDEEDGNSARENGKNDYGAAEVEDPASLYGKIDKSRKSVKSPAGNGVSDPYVPSAEDPPEDGMVNKPMKTFQARLDYADLDHGSQPATGVIHQSRVEPTQYEDVQLQPQPVQAPLVI